MGQGSVVHKLRRYRSWTKAAKVMLAFAVGTMERVHRQNADSCERGEEVGGIGEREIALVSRSHSGFAHLGEEAPVDRLRRTLGPYLIPVPGFAHKKRGRAFSS